MIDLKKLIENGVQFGHQTSRWSPKMKPYIWGIKNDIHLIDVSKTAQQLENAAKFLESVASEGHSILWVGTKKSASALIEKVGTELNLPSVAHRWVGGTFSNARQVKRAVANLLHYEDILTKSDQFNYSKKEQSTLKKKIGRLEKIVGGIRNLTWPVGAVVIVDVKKEHVAVKEANSVGIPVVGIVDTNSDPSGVDYVIPANDDAPKSIAVLLDYLAEAVKKGLETAANKPKVETMTETVETLYDTGFTPDEEEEKTGVKKGTAGAGRRPTRRTGAPVRKPTTEQKEVPKPTEPAAE